MQHDGGPVGGVASVLCGPSRKGEVAIFKEDVVAVWAEEGLWLPNTTRPPWLDGSLPGDRGFDPLGLAKPTEYLQVSPPFRLCREQTGFCGVLPRLMKPTAGFWHQCGLLPFVRSWFYGSPTQPDACC